jgi:hypothetical protein
MLPYHPVTGKRAHLSHLSPPVRSHRPTGPLTLCETRKHKLITNPSQCRGGCLASPAGGELGSSQAAYVVNRRGQGWSKDLVVGTFGPILRMPGGQPMVGKGGQPYEEEGP